MTLTIRESHYFHIQKESLCDVCLICASWKKLVRGFAWTPTGDRIVIVELIPVKSDTSHDIINFLFCVVPSISAV